MFFNSAYKSSLITQVLQNDKTELRMSETHKDMEHVKGYKTIAILNRSQLTRIHTVYHSTCNWNPAKIDRIESMIWVRLASVLKTIFHQYAV